MKRPEWQCNYDQAPADPVNKLRDERHAAIGQRMKFIRVECWKRTLRAASRILGVLPSSLLRMERGAMIPAAVLVSVLSWAPSVDPHWLLFGSADGAAMEKLQRRFATWVAIRELHNKRKAKR